MPFIPISREEALERGWTEFDIIFVTGDAYVDHPSFGVPLLARLLESRGFRVGIIPQPDWRTAEAFASLGRPTLFFAVSAGAMDSMVAHYTPARKLRRDDAYTPGNRHGARPNRACLVYANRIKEVFKDVPVVLGGIEASLRRFAHYDFWEDRVRRSLLFDAKADLLIYGMGERPLLELAERLRNGERIDEITDIRGTAFRAKTLDINPTPGSLLELPSFDEVATDRQAFAKAHRQAEHEMNPFCGAVLAQRHGDSILVCNPPVLPLGEAEMDELYRLPFEKAPHPSYREKIPAYEQIRCSITTHRGCMGGCSFCAIAFHQGKIIQSRSESSILDEVTRLTKFAWFSGTISDVGGPTANMYGAYCGDPVSLRSCRRVSCLYPELCGKLQLADKKSASLLRAVRGVAGVKFVAVASGVRFDLLARQRAYMHELVNHHVGGLLKVAPEHLVDAVTKRMRKPSREVFLRFLDYFRKETKRLNKRYSLVPYLMSGHPGCTLNDMVDAAVALKNLGLRVEQVQDFTPTPGTYATCMYHSGIDPFTGEHVFVARTDREKRMQKSLLLYHLPQERNSIIAALKKAGREDAAGYLCVLNATKPGKSQRGTAATKKRWRSVNTSQNNLKVHKKA